MSRRRVFHDAIRDVIDAAGFRAPLMRVQAPLTPLQARATLLMLRHAGATTRRCRRASHWLFTMIVYFSSATACAQHDAAAIDHIDMPTFISRAREHDETRRR